MKIDWIIEPSDVERVRVFVESQLDDAFVKHRIATNLRPEKPPVNKEVFWYWLVGCLLTTQQRSGPTSAVTKFLDINPFPLRYDACLSQGDGLRSFAEEVLGEFGGLRRFNVIGKEIDANLQYLEGGGWGHVMDQMEQLRTNQTVDCERQAANFIDDHLKGFGPKQSRNLLQSVGLTRYEIPIDSRITKWLNAFGFPVRLSANVLGDRNYYAFVSDGFQQLCKRCDVMPCVLDAAIFASFDDGGWNDVKLAE